VAAIAPRVLALGIDPGTRHLGWGLVRRDGARLSHVAHGTLHLDAAAPLASRLLDLDRRLSGLLVEHHPDVAAVETIFFHKDAQAAAKLGHARGVVLLALARQGITTCEYAPARVKRTIAGTGQAKKAQVARMVCALLGLAAAPGADAADALALALTHLRGGDLTAALAAPREGLARGRRGKSRGRSILRALARERGA